MGGLVIGIVGMAGSGKSVLAQHLSSKGWPTLRFGALVIEELHTRGLALNPANEQIVREDMRRQHGVGALAFASLPKIRELLKSNDVVIVDGIYSQTEYKILREELGTTLVVVAVYTERALRYDRISRRPERPFSKEEAETRDYAEIDNLEKGGPIAIADYTLLNNGPEQTLYDATDTLLGQVLNDMTPLGN